MASTCPPGVICIENMSIFMIIICIAIIGIIIYLLQNQSHPQMNKIIIKENGMPQSIFPQISSSYSNIPNDVLLNPYTAPLKDDRYILDQTGGDPRGIPINISTRAVDTTYRQVGLLTRLNGPETMLPLMGRPLYTNRDKWQFYTMSDKNNNLKLPVSNRGKSCTGEYGCDNVSNGDTVYVEGYNDAFKVTLYDNAVMKYIPFI